MTTQVILKKSAVAAKVPLVTDLEYGELALNYADGKLYYKNTTDIIAELGGGSASAGPTSLTISNKTAAYTVVAADLGTVINCTNNTFTVSLTSAVTLGRGFNCWIWNNSDFGTVTIDPSGTQTIDTQEVLVLRVGEGMQIVSDGVNWQIGDKKAMRGYAENINAAFRAVASGESSVAIGPLALSSGTGSIALGGLAAGGYSIAIGSPNRDYVTAGSINSTAIGFNSGSYGAVTAINNAAMALGGSYASGIDSFAAAIVNNTSSYGATGANSVAIGNRAKAAGLGSIAIGTEATATGEGSVALGARNTSTGTESFSSGGSNTASGPWSVAMGLSNTASGSRGVALGNSNTASNFYTVALGSLCEATQNSAICTGSRGRSDIQGKRVHSSSSFSSEIGSAQIGDLVLGKQTTDATATVLTSNPGNEASALNQVILPNNSAYFFSGTIIARQRASEGTDIGAWEIKGAIRREETAATTTLIKSTIDEFSAPAGWSIAITADTTNGGLAITVTGANATNIRWVATIKTSEVTY